MRLGSIITLLLLVGSLQAQLFFNPLTVKDGLAQSSVNFVIADKQGYYWIGTQYGLSRYNGHEFENFYTSSHEGISDNFFINAISDNYGNLWFATRNGLCRYLIETKKFQTLVVPLSKTSMKGYNPIWSLAKTPEGDIYFIAAATCYSISAQDCASDRPAIRPLFASDQSFRYLACSASQLVLLQMDSLVLYKRKGQTLRQRKSFKHSLGESNQTVVLRYINNKFYIANQNKIFKLEDTTLLKINTPYITADISDLQQHKESILVSTYQGLFQTNSQFVLQKHYTHTKETAFSLSENKLLSISLTPDNCLWIGTANSGINVHKPGTEQFTVLSKIEGQRYLSFCVQQVSDTKLLAGTESGYDVFEKRNAKWLYSGSRFANHKVTSILCQNTNLFIGTTQGLYFETNNSFKRIEALPEDAQVFDLQLNKLSQQLVISSTEGILVLDLNTLKALHVINRKTKNAKNKLVIGTNYVFSTYLQNSATFVANTTTGVYKIDSTCNDSENLLEQYPYKSLNEIMIVKSILINNRWYCGSLGNGLYRISKDTISVISSQHGLSNNVIASLEKDPDDNVWLSTNNGISCYTKNGHVLAFTDELPLLSSEFITNGSSTFENTIWFCSNSGIIGFEPRQLLKNARGKPLQLQLELISKNYTDTLSADSVLEFSTADKNISFRFCVPGISTFNKTSIVYRLSGFDTTWHALGNNKAVTFSNLNAGNYVLDVIAKLQGTEIAVARKYILNVTPPIYQRTWFVISVSVFAIIITILLVYYFSRVRLKRKLLLLQAEQKVYEEKQRISEELHDNIGSQISTIISGLDKMQLKGQVPQAEQLSDFARGTLHELRETIWALHLSAVSVNEIRSKMENHVFELRNNFEEIIFETSFIISNNASFEPEKALSIFRIFQEALSNALKHSVATKLSIQLCSNEIDFSIVVADNGKGFDTGLRKNGHYGLDNMTARAIKHGLTFEIQSELNKGTQITLLLKYND